MQQVDIHTFLDLRDQRPVLDVRSPGEYEQGHIVHAHSMPLFDNEERAEVGTLYKQKGREPAIKRGLDIVGPKMRPFIEYVESMNTRDVLLHCWRGGMRSASVGWLLETYGFDVTTLEGGYKAYRRAALDYFEQPLKLKVLTGYTGSMKTEVLWALRERGEQVVDLEGLANHQGSAFGNRLCDGQPSSEHFQNKLFEAFRPLVRQRRIWVEDESFAIGKVRLIKPFYDQKECSPQIFLDVPQAQRVQHLQRNYGRLSADKLIEATDSIRKRLGHEKADMAQERIAAGDLATAAGIILTYYDKRYRKAVERKKELIEVHLEDASNDPEVIAEKLLATCKN